MALRPVVVTTTNIPVSPVDDVLEEEPDFGLLPETQKLVGCLLDAAAAASTYDDDEEILDDDDDDDDDKEYVDKNLL